MNTPKILIIGFTQSGKSTAARLLAEHYGVSCMSTSQAIGFHLEGLVPGAMRVHYTLRLEKDEIGALARKFLFGVGNHLRLDDPAYLVKFCMESECRIVEGVRTAEEHRASRDLFDRVLWIWRDGVVRGATDELHPHHADRIIHNNGTEADLLRKLVAAIEEK